MAQIMAQINQPRQQQNQHYNIDFSKKDKKIINTRNNANDVCSICYGDFDINAIKDEKVVYLKECKHKFHKGCIEGWINRGHTDCPICRKGFTTYYGIRRNTLKKIKVGEIYEMEIKIIDKIINPFISGLTTKQLNSKIVPKEYAKKDVIITNINFHPHMLVYNEVKVNELYDLFPLKERLNRHQIPKNIINNEISRYIGNNNDNPLKKINSYFSTNWRNTNRRLFYDQTMNLDELQEYFNKLKNKKIYWDVEESYMYPDDDPLDVSEEYRFPLELLDKTFLVNEDEGSSDTTTFILINPLFNYESTIPYDLPMKLSTVLPFKTNVDLFKKNSANMLLMSISFTPKNKTKIQSNRGAENRSGGKKKDNKTKKMKKTRRNKRNKKQTKKK